MKQSSARFQTRPQHHPKEGFRPYGTCSLAPSPEMPPPLQEQQKQQQINQNDDRGEKNQGFNSNSMVNQSNQRARTPYREFGNSRRIPAPQFRNDHGRTRVEPYYVPPLQRQSERPPPLQQHQNNDQGERNQGFNSNSMVNQSNREHARTPYREFGNSRSTPAPQFRNDHGRTRVDPEYVPPRQSERPPPLQQQQQRNENNDQGERNQGSNSNSMVNQSNQRARTPYREFGNSRRTPAPQFRNDHGRTRVEPEQPPSPQRQQKQREQPSRSRSSNTENRNTRQEHQPTSRSRSRSAVNRQPRSRSRQPLRSRSTRKARDPKIFRNKIKITSNLDDVMNMMCIDMNQDDIPFVPNIFCHHEVINFEDQNESFNQIAALVEHLSK